MKIKKYSVFVPLGTANNFSNVFALHEFFPIFRVFLIGFGDLFSSPPNPLAHQMFEISWGRGGCALFGHGSVLDPPVLFLTRRSIQATKTYILCRSSNELSITFVNGNFKSAFVFYRKRKLYSFQNTLYRLPLWRQLEGNKRLPKETAKDSLLTPDCREESAVYWMFVVQFFHLFFLGEY